MVGWDRAAAVGQSWWWWQKGEGGRGRKEGGSDGMERVATVAWRGAATAVAQR